MVTRVMRGMACVTPGGGGRHLLPGAALPYSGVGLRGLGPCALLPLRRVPPGPPARLSERSPTVTTNEPAVRADGLTKRYSARSGVAAVEGLSLRVRRGILFGLVGPDGAARRPPCACSLR